MSSTLQPDVAIVGGGPAGLGCAIELRRRGVGHVLVLERESEAGGMTRHCGHPPFGWREFGCVLKGPAYARRLSELAQRSGVDVRTGHSVVALGADGVLTVSSPDQLLSIRARKTVFAAGARESTRAARLTSGDRPIGVINTGTLQGCIYLKHMRPFQRPVIVGSELVSLSAIWTCHRHGIRPVAIIESGRRPLSPRLLALYPRLAGIPMYFESTITELVGRPRVLQVIIRTAGGKALPIDCDGVLFTGQFLPESSLLRQAGITVDPGSGGPTIDQFGRCSQDGLFATGNALRPIETAGWSHFEGRRVGQCVAEDLAQPLPAQHVASFERGHGIKLVVPQRVVSPSAGLGMQHLQVRSSLTTRGHLSVRQEARIVWSRRLPLRPEQRLLIPIRALALPPGDATFMVSIEPDR